jgi:hypothetical protein
MRALRTAALLAPILLAVGLVTRALMPQPLAASRFTIAYCTLLGGNGEDMIRSLAFGPEGEMYLVGNTSSADFPTSPHALRGKPAGSEGDAFVVKLARRG